MLAINHVTLATAVTLGLSVYYDRPFFLPFTLFVVFASLLPDIDHPNSDMSHIFPVINKAFKHRGVTHSFLGTAAVLGIFYFLLGREQILTYVLLVIGLVGVFFAQKILSANAQNVSKATHGFFSAGQTKLVVTSLSWLLGIFFVVLAFLVWKQEFRIEILELIILGYLLHILGDFLTVEGVPLFWPIKWMLGLKLFRTGGPIETVIGLLLVPINIYAFYIFYTHFDLSNIEYWRHYLPV